ncbi:phospholipid-binding protein MlaC [Thermodesulfobacteriota bacterium]
MTKRHILGIMLALLLTVCLHKPIMGATPESSVQGTTTKIMDILADPSLMPPEMAGERKRRIREAVNERFDWQEMSRRALGRHWRKRTKQEKEAFTALFAKLLEGAYMQKVANYSGEKVSYEDERVDGDYGAVTAKVLTNKNEEISVEYRVKKKTDNWLVYDISIEGVSLVNNYRTQFNNILRKSSFSELMKRLDEKVAQK